MVSISSSRSAGKPAVLFALLVLLRQFWHLSCKANRSCFLLPSRQIPSCFEAPVSFCTYRCTVRTAGFLRGRCVRRLYIFGSTAPNHSDGSGNRLSADRTWYRRRHILLCAGCLDSKGQAVFSLPVRNRISGWNSGMAAACRYRCQI